MPGYSNRNANDVSQEALKERSYLWMARTFGLICVVTVIVNLMLYGALSSLLPTVRVQPFYITTQDKDQQVITIVRPPVAQLRSEVLQESFIRQYLLARLGIGTDVSEVERRWRDDGTVQWMSSASVFNEFQNKSARPLLERAHEEGLTRDVRILNVRRIPRPDNQIVWEADVEVSDMSQNSTEPQVSAYKITMGVSFGNFRSGLIWKDRLKNPLGFVVNTYGQVPTR